MHAQRDIVMANPSVRPSVRPSHFGIVSKRMHIVRLRTGRGMALVFERYRRYKIPRKNPSPGC